MIPARVRRALAVRLARTPVALPGDMAPTLSFTFDDVPRSAVRTARPLLDAAGFRATWYVAGSLLDAETEVGRVLGPDDVVALHAGGHEIGSHGHAHRRADRFTRGGFAEDLRDNRAALAAMTGAPPRSYSFPFGVARPAHKRTALRHHASARGIEPGIARGAVDLALLPANALYGDAGDCERLDGLLADLAAGGGWAILYTHDVALMPSPWGCTPALFAHAVARAGALGIAVETVGTMVDRLTAAR